MITVQKIEMRKQGLVMISNEHFGGYIGESILKSVEINWNCFPSFEAYITDNDFALSNQHWKVSY